MKLNKYHALLLTTAIIGATFFFIDGFKTLKPALDEPNLSSENKKSVAIARFFSSQPALDNHVKSMKAELTSLGYIEGQNIDYIERSASEQTSLIPTIVSEISARNPDVVVSMTTSVSSAFVNKITVPLVFGAVTDPVGEGILESLDIPKKLITGTSDAWPYREQLLLVREIDDNIKTIGVLYDPGNSASQYGIIRIRAFAKELGFELIETGVTSIGEMRLASKSMATKVDALFLSSDTTVISGIASATKTAIENKIPLFVGDSGTVSKGGMAAVSVGYSELGKQAAKLVARALDGEQYIPVYIGVGSDLHINTKSAELMGVQIPAKTLKRATKVYSEISK